MDNCDLNTILTENSTKRYAIEYRGLLSNHLSHGVIALAKLGANKQRIEKFINWYSNRLEEPSQQPNELSLPENRPKDTFDYKSLLGKRISYFPIWDYYNSLFQNECEESMEKFISKYFPLMAEGMSCSALHSIIHTGYGYSAKNPQLVVEGIAYLHHSYFPIQIGMGKDFEFGNGTTDVLDIVDEVRENTALTEFMLHEAAHADWFLPEWKSSDFLKRLAVLLHSKGDDFASYVSHIKLPEWFSIQSVSIGDVLKLTDWVIDCAIAVYQASEQRNDFFLLHRVTAAWSLRQILSAFSESQVKDAIICIKLYLCFLLVVYMVQGSPKVNRGYLSEKVDKSWDEIKQEALANELDEHIYKVIQVCYERSQAYSQEKQHLFKSASLVSLNYNFIF